MKIIFYFGDKKINKSAFNKNKEPINVINVDINKIVILKTKSYDKKDSFRYVIGYDDNDDIRPLCIMLRQMIRYAKYFDSNTTMSFMASDKNLLKTYDKIW